MLHAAELKYKKKERKELTNPHCTAYCVTQNEAEDR